MRHAALAIVTAAALAAAPPPDDRATPQTLRYDLRVGDHLRYRIALQ